jgi:hypothetical protein
MAGTPPDLAEDSRRSRSDTELFLFGSIVLATLIVATLVYFNAEEGASIEGFILVALVGSFGLTCVMYRFERRKKEAPVGPLHPYLWRISLLLTCASAFALGMWSSDLDAVERWGLILIGGTFALLLGASIVRMMLGFDALWLYKVVLTREGIAERTRNGTLLIPWSHVLESKRGTFRHRWVPARHECIFLALNTSESSTWRVLWTRSRSAPRRHLRQRLRVMAWNERETDARSSSFQSRSNPRCRNSST